MASLFVLDSENQDSEPVIEAGILMFSALFFCCFSFCFRALLLGIDSERGILTQTYRQLFCLSS